MKKFMRVVSLLMAAVLLVTAAGVPGASAQAKTNEKNVVVLYFSATGTTKAVAKKIQKATGGKLVAIKASDPYTEKDLDWSNEKSRVSKEHASAASPAKSSVRPKIKNLAAIKKAVKSADIVYLGYPIWWGEAPHILYTLVEKVSLKKKTVVPFCTSLSSGLGNSAKHLKKNAIISKTTNWLKGRNFSEGVTQKKVTKWVNSLNLGTEDSASTEAADSSETDKPTAAKTLVVYFSATNNTETVAGYIADVTGADLFELVPTEPYTAGDLNWTDPDSRVCREHDDASLRVVELEKAVPDNWEEYGTVFVGYPIWWGNAAWPVGGFISSNDFTGKTVIPFCTSSSSGIGQSGELLRDAAGTGNWLAGQRFRSGASEQEVKAWVADLEL